MTFDWPKKVIEHLINEGRITAATALATYGSFRLADAIYRLKREKAHLVPEGKCIIMLRRKDQSGRPFGEYRLVDKVLADKREQRLGAR